MAEIPKERRRVAPFHCDQIAKGVNTSGGLCPLSISPQKWWVVVDGNFCKIRISGAAALLTEIIVGLRFLQLFHKGLIQLRFRNRIIC